MSTPSSLFFFFFFPSFPEKLIPIAINASSGIPRQIPVAAILNELSIFLFFQTEGAREVCTREDE